MEMHQIRYFLAVARTLNFTRAAETCNVAQPSLTRAIKLLEAELGGDLFRRERNLSHLTDLGQRMLPLIQQCYDTAIGVKSLAAAIKSGELATLSIGLSRTIDIRMLIPLLSELLRAIKGLKLKFLRGTAEEIADLLKRGEADIAISGPIAKEWERFEAQALFSEEFVLLVSPHHRFAGMPFVTIGDIKEERLIVRTYCELAESIAAHIRSDAPSRTLDHEVMSEDDLVSLLAEGIGVSIVPKSTFKPDTLMRRPIEDLGLSRSVFAYTVSGRMRSAAAGLFMKQLRATNWARLAD